VERHEIHDLIAAYALDALEEREATEFENHLGRCAECQRELASLQGTASRLAYAADGPAPSPALRGRILAEARRERENVVPLRPRWAFPVAAAAAVAAVAAIALGIWAASLSSSLDEERQARSAQDRALAVLAEPGSKTVPLEGAEGSLVIASDGTAALVLASLDEAPGDKIYEAWVSADGKTMTPAGTFEASEGRTVVALTRPVPAGGLVAVTIEERPVDKPTGAPLFLAQTA
jgi:anti-sigma factor RsiW